MQPHVMFLHYLFRSLAEAHCGCRVWRHSVDAQYGLMALRFQHAVWSTPSPTAQPSAGCGWCWRLTERMFLPLPGAVRRVNSVGTC